MLGRSSDPFAHVRFDFFADEGVISGLRTGKGRDGHVEYPDITLEKGWELFEKLRMKGDELASRIKGSAIGHALSVFLLCNSSIIGEFSIAL